MVSCGKFLKATSWGMLEVLLCKAVWNLDLKKIIKEEFGRAIWKKKIGLGVQDLLF